MVLRPGAGSLLLAYKCELDFIKTTFLSFGDLFTSEFPDNADCSRMNTKCAYLLYCGKRIAGNFSLRNLTLAQLYNYLQPYIFLSKIKSQNDKSQRLNKMKDYGSPDNTYSVTTKRNGLHFHKHKGQKEERHKYHGNNLDKLVVQKDSSHKTSQQKSYE